MIWWRRRHVIQLRKSGTLCLRAADFFQGHKKVIPFKGMIDFLPCVKRAISPLLCVRPGRMEKRMRHCQLAAQPETTNSVTAVQSIHSRMLVSKLATAYRKHAACWITCFRRGLRSLRECGSVKITSLCTYHNTRFKLEKLQQAGLRPYLWLEGLILL